MKYDYLTVAQAAQLKGVARGTIYNAINRGELHTHQILGKTTLRRSAVEKWQPGRNVGRRKGSAMTVEWKARISESQKRRWARHKSESERA